MLPAVDFCGLNVTRLVIGANPFGGYSHQTPERDVAMREYHTVERIKETWALAEDAGINTMICNNETPHVFQAAQEYLRGGGKLQWIAQVNRRLKLDMDAAIREVVELGAKAVYLHGWVVDDAYRRGDAASLTAWLDLARSHGVPAGVAGHNPRAHRWVDTLGIADFHAVCFFNCGSVHAGEGERFLLADMLRAIETIQAIRKPCIGYKVMGAGRIDPRMALEHAYASIKPGDVVNVGMHRGDRDDMVRANAALAGEILARQQTEAVAYA